MESLKWEQVNGPRDFVYDKRCDTCGFFALRYFVALGCRVFIHVYFCDFILPFGGIIYIIFTLALPRPHLQLVFLG